MRAARTAAESWSRVIVACGATRVFVVKTDVVAVSSFIFNYTKAAYAYCEVLQKQ